MGSQLFPSNYLNGKTEQQAMKTHEQIRSTQKDHTISGKLNDNINMDSIKVGSCNAHIFKWLLTKKAYIYIYIRLSLLSCIAYTLIIYQCLTILTNMPQEHIKNCAWI